MSNIPRFAVPLFTTTLVVGSVLPASAQVTTPAAVSGEAPVAETAASSPNDKSPTAIAEMDREALPSSSVTVDHQALAGREAFSRLLQSTAWIVVFLDDGRQSYKSGTAWVVDRDRKLLITNHHVVQMGSDVAKDDQVVVYFPFREDGRTVVEKGQYLQRLTPVKAKVFDAEIPRDLALIQVETLPDEAVALPMAAEGPSPGDEVYSLGNPGASDALWVFSTGSVRQVYRARVKYDTGDIRDFLRVETQSPTNPGDSGGPVINSHGELVAVNQGALGSARLMTYFIDVSEVKAFLGEVEPFLNPMSAEDFHARGNHFYDRGRYDRAVLDFAKAIEFRPDFAEAIADRGWSFLQLDDLDTAAADFDAAIAKENTNATYFYGRAITRRRQEKFKDALADATEAIRLDPSQARYYYERGEVNYYSGDYAAAIKDYTRRIELEADAESYFSRGICHARLSNDQAAIPDLTQAIHLVPADGRYYFERAEAHRRLDNEEAANQDYALMEQADPAYAQSKRSTFNRKYVRISNQTGERIQVWLKYYTITTDEEWKWFPEKDTTWAVYTFEPGESNFVEHEGFRVNAQQIRIWAGNNVEDWQKSTHVWARDENTPITVVDGDGYESYYMQTYEYTFRP